MILQNSSRLSEHRNPIKTRLDDFFSVAIAMTSVSCCDAGGSRAESISGEPICNDVDVDFVDELPKVDKVFKKTHKRDESRISKISRLSIKSLKGLDGVDGASDVGDKPIPPFPGRLVRSLVLSDPETINAT